MDLVARRRVVTYEEGRLGMGHNPPASAREPVHPSLVRPQMEAGAAPGLQALPRCPVGGRPAWGGATFATLVCALSYRPRQCRMAKWDVVLRYRQGTARTPYDLHPEPCLPEWTA
jgi:hypothetical protein